MTSNRSPDDVSLAGPDLRPICEDRPAVSGPGQLEAPRHTSNAFDSQAWPELIALQILNKATKGSTKGTSLFREHPAVSIEKCGRCLKGRQGEA